MLVKGNAGRYIYIYIYIYIYNAKLCQIIVLCNCRHVPSLVLERKNITLNESLVVTLFHSPTFIPLPHKKKTKTRNKIKHKISPKLRNVTFF